MACDMKDDETTEAEKEALLVKGRRALIHLLSKSDKSDYDKGICSFCKQATLDVAIVAGSGAVICIDCFKVAASELEKISAPPSQ